jgi:hypothetical protein
MTNMRRRKASKGDKQPNRRAEESADIEKEEISRNAYI